ncbi:MAG: hypothetical protein R3C30_02445 [Hyphomonadaceae bacterium]
MSRAAIFVATIACATPAAAQTAYFTLVPDLPIAPGLAEMPSSLGPIAYADGSQMFLLQARGETAPANVQRFYADSLSALGWAFEPTGEGELSYMRGRERLTLLIAPLGEGTIMRATLTITPASMNAD